MSTQSEVEFLEEENAELREVIAVTQSEVEFLEEENAELREVIAVTRERLENLAAGMEMSASTSHPSKKSEIERGCAEAVRGIVTELKEPSK